MLSLALAMIAAPPEASSDRHSRMIITGYADCIVEQRPDEARRAVLENWEPLKLTDSLLRTQTGCARPGLEMRFQGAAIKAAMAGALARRELGHSDIAAVPGAPALSYDMPEPLKTVDGKGRPLPRKRLEEEQEKLRKAASWVAIAQFGECIARANPVAVPPLFNSVAGSDAEMAAIKAFSGQMPACLPKGVKLELDRSTLRNSITFAYYRLAMAARQAKSTGAAQ